jgi:hypothetical protein
MCLRIKFCNHQRPGRAKFLKSLNPNPYVISLMPCLLYSKQNNTLIILNVHKRPCHSFSVKGHRRKKPVRWRCCQSTRHRQHRVPCTETEMLANCKGVGKPTIPSHPWKSNNIYFTLLHACTVQYSKFMSNSSLQQTLNKKINNLTL